MPQQPDRIATEAASAAPCWQDVRLPGVGPGVWMTAAFFYLVFVAVLARFGLDCEPVWVALMFAAIPMTVLPAIHAARRLSDQARIGQLRGEFGTVDPNDPLAFAGRASWKYLGAAHAAPLKTFALLLPVYVCAILGSSETGEAAGAAFAFALSGLVSICAAVTLGAAVAGIWPGRALLRAILLAFFLVVVRFALGLLFIYGNLTERGHGGTNEYLKELQLLAYADTVLCGLVMLPLSWVAQVRLKRRLLQFAASWVGLPPGPEVHTAMDAHVAREKAAEIAKFHKQQSLADDLPDTGLDVSAWSLVRWRFWRDPLFRAERRHLWSGRRIAVLWAVLPFVLAGLFALNQLVWWGLFSLPSSSRIFMRASTLYSLFGAVTALPYACVSMLFLAALTSAEKDGAVFESMAVTPLTPLRLTAARFLGKAWHLVLAVAVLGAVGAILQQILMRVPPGGSEAEFRIARLLVLPSGTFCSAARAVLFAAVGMFFAARQRTLTGAILGGVSAALGLLLASSLFNVVQPKWAFHASSSDNNLLSYVVGTVAVQLAQTVLCVLATGMFLAGAARHMTLRRENAE